MQYVTHLQCWWVEITNCRRVKFILTFISGMVYFFQIVWDILGREMGKLLMCGVSVHVWSDCQHCYITVRDCVLVDVQPMLPC